MKKTTIRLEALTPESDFEGYQDFVTASYPTDVWVYDWESDSDKNELIFYSIDSQEDSVKDFISQTCEGAGFKIAFDDFANVSEEEWAEAMERLDLEEDDLVDE